MATGNDQSNPRSAECSICFNLLQKPKLLSCHHTFCEGCLVTLYRSQGEHREVSCPLCRETTHVPDGKISSLGTNHALQSLVEELASRVLYCTVCKSIERPLGKTYCSDCDKFMCNSCNTAHRKWADFSEHTVVTVAEVAAGKVSVKRKLKCWRHSDKDGDFFCEDCDKYACVVCRVHEHLQHNIVEDEEREKSRRENLRHLLDQLQLSKSYLRKYVNFIDEEQKETKIAIQKNRVQIETARDAAIQRINEHSNSLLLKCEKLEKDILDKQGDMQSEVNKHLASIKSAGGLVTKGIKARLCGDALIAHDTLCQELEKLLGDFEISYPKVRKLTRCALGNHFKRVDPELGLFEQRSGWILSKIAHLPDGISMNSIAPTPDGRMAVGTNFGGIEIFSVDGLLKQIVLKNTDISDVAFLSDGRCVVCNMDNSIILLTKEWEKIDVRFETHGCAEDETGSLVVDRDDLIYVCFDESNKILVFTPAGGKAIREILCDGYQPRQMSASKSRKTIVVQDKIFTKVINEHGIVQHEITHSPNDVFTCSTVCHDDSIIIASVTHTTGLVYIAKYTYKLEHVETLINLKIPKEEHNWYFLGEFLTGELALCSPKTLYIFHQYVTLADV